MTDRNKDTNCSMVLNAKNAEDVQHCTFTGGHSGRCSFEPEVTLNVPVYIDQPPTRHDEPCLLIEVQARYLGDEWREQREIVLEKLREVFPR